MTNQIATRLTDTARAEWATYLATRCTSEAVAAAYLSDIERGGHNGACPEIGANVEIAGRHEISGNPNPLHIDPSDYIWEAAED